MSLLSLLSAGANIAGGMLSKNSNKSVAGFGDNLGMIGAGLGKIPGIPTPADPIGPTESGLNAKMFMDSAYPGTNAWERLGAQGGGASGVGNAVMDAKKQFELQKSELIQRERIANNTNLSSVIASATPHGAQAMRSAARMLQTGGMDTPDYDNPQKLHRDTAGGKTEHSQAEIDQKKYGYLNPPVQVLKSGYAWAKRGVSNYMSKANQDNDRRRRIVQQIQNNGRRPARLIA